MRIVLLLFVAFVLAVGTGCSFSKSSGSISDSISSPSKSSSKSSSGDDEKTAPETPQDTASYHDDVSQLAYTYAKSGGDIGAFRSAVSKLATKRGVTNWEVDATTCVAIGTGVGKAGMQETKFVEFSKTLFGDDLTKQASLRKGFRPYAPKSTETKSGTETATP
jgi:hypothetical protein